MGDTGFEPVAPTLSWWYSTPELIARVFAQLLILQPLTTTVKHAIAQSDRVSVPPAIALPWQAVARTAQT